MRIAIPVVETGELAEEFSGAGVFALYDVNDQTRAVGYLGREAMAAEGCGSEGACGSGGSGGGGGGGCGAAAGFLRGKGVEVVMAHQISEGGVGHLRAAGIVAIKDAPLLSADALMAHLVSGTLQATPPEVPEGAASAGGGCGSGGCGHCCGGGGGTHA